MVGEDRDRVRNTLCYDSFPLSIYSLDCSLLSHTYLER